MARVLCWEWPAYLTWEWPAYLTWEWPDWALLPEWHWPDWPDWHLPSPSPWHWPAIPVPGGPRADGRRRQQRLGHAQLAGRSHDGRRVWAGAGALARRQPASSATRRVWRWRGRAAQTVNVGPVYVSDKVDVEALAYRVADDQCAEGAVGENAVQIVATVATDRYTLYLADCLEVLPTLPVGSVDAGRHRPAFRDRLQVCVAQRHARRLWRVAAACAGRPRACASRAHRSSSGRRCPTCAASPPGFRASGGSLRRARTSCRCARRPCSTASTRWSSGGPRRGAGRPAR